MRKALFAAALLLAGPAIAQTADERAELESAAERGRALAVLDRAAQRATQDLLAKIADPVAAGVEGYVIEPDASGASGAIVTFYAAGGAGPVALYRGTIARDGSIAGELFEEDARPALTPVQRRMAEAREAAEALDRTPCGIDMFNSFVLPVTTAEAPAEVYLLSPQTERARFPSGGHYHVTFGADGSLLDSEALAEQCDTIDLAADQPAVEADGALPNALHMFIAAKTGKRLNVTAGGRTWLVDVTGIALAPADRADADAAALRTQGSETGR